jgi:hypothetical protein
MANPFPASDPRFARPPRRLVSGVEAPDACSVPARAAPEHAGGTVSRGTACPLGASLRASPASAAPNVVLRTTKKEPMRCGASALCVWDRRRELGRD